MALLAQRLQHGAQRSGFMRVVDEGEERLPAVHRLQSAGHGGVPKPRRGLLRGHPRGVQQCHREQSVGHVVAAGQPDLQTVMDPGGIHRDELLDTTLTGGDVFDGPIASRFRSRSPVTAR